MIRRCCAIPKLCAAFGLACFLLGSVFAWPQQGWAQQQKRYLVVQSESYSRFEIVDGDVIAYYPSGITCTYFGNQLSADEFRYNRATQVATATGNVVLTTTLGTLNCAEIKLDGVQGLVDIPGTISGQLSDPALAFTAGGAQLTFPPGQESWQSEDTHLALLGGVHITTPDGSQLDTEKIEYDPSERRLTAPQPFIAEALVNGVQVVQEDTTTDQPTRLKLKGDNLLATLTEAGAFAAATITQAVAELPDGQVAGDLLELRMPPAADGVEVQSIIIRGDPLHGWLRQPRETLSFSAQQVRLELQDGEVSGARLEQAVQLATASSLLQCELLDVKRMGKAFSIAAPDGVHVDFDLAALSGSTPIDLPDLGSFAERK